MTTTGTTQELAAPLGSVGVGRLVFMRGASHLTLRVDDSMEDLYRARFDRKVPVGHRGPLGNVACRGRPRGPGAQRSGDLGRDERFRAVLAAPNETRASSRVVGLKPHMIRPRRVRVTRIQPRANEPAIPPAATSGALTSSGTSNERRASAATISGSPWNMKAA